MLETSCMKGTSVHIKNMRIKELSNHKVSDSATALRVRKVFGTFEKRAPGVDSNGTVFSFPPTAE